MGSNRLMLADYLQGQGTFGKNYVRNPSGFKNISQGITASGTVVTRNTTTPLTAISDVQIVFDANTDYAEFTLKTLDNSLSGQTCELTADYKLTLGSGATVQAQILTGATLINSMDLPAASTSQGISLMVPCGDLSSSTTVRFSQTVSSSTSTLNVANVYYGAAKNIGTAAQAEVCLSARRASSNQAIGSTTVTTVITNQIDIQGSCVSHNTSTGVATILVDGNYQISTELAFANLDTNGAFIRVLAGGTQYTPGLSGATAVASGSTISVYLTAGQTVELRSESAVDTSYEVQNSVNSRLQITRIPTQSEQVFRVGAPGLNWTNYTPTGSWSTNTTWTGSYQCSAGTLQVYAKATLAGAPTSTEFGVDLPSGFVIDTTKIDATANFGVIPGQTAINDSTTNGYKAYPIYFSTTRVRAAYQNNASGAAALVTQAAPITFGSGDAVSIAFSVPVTASSPCASAPMPLLKNAVTTGRAATSKDAFFRVNCSSSSSIVEDADGAVAVGGVSNIVAGVCTINFTPGFWPNDPLCTGGRTTSLLNTTSNNGTATTSSVSIASGEGGVAATTFNYNMFCRGSL